MTPNSLAFEFEMFHFIFFCHFILCSANVKGKTVKRTIDWFDKMLGAMAIKVKQMPVTVDTLINVRSQSWNRPHFIEQFMMEKCFWNFILFVTLINCMQICCCSACGTEDCPVDCEDRYKCIDKSEFCEQLKHHCENFFLRKCMRCACPKTCGVCGRHPTSDDDEPRKTTITSSPSSTSVAFTTPELVFSTDPFLLDLTNSTIASTFPTTETFNSTIEVISDEEFKNPSKMKCKSCDAKRKKLAEIYEKYYPKE